MNGYEAKLISSFLYHSVPAVCISCAEESTSLKIHLREKLHMIMRFAAKVSVASESLLNTMVFLRVS